MNLKASNNKWNLSSHYKNSSSRLNTLLTEGLMYHGYDPLLDSTDSYNQFRVDIANTAGFARSTTLFGSQKSDGNILSQLVSNGYTEPKQLPDSFGNQYTNIISTWLSQQTSSTKNKQLSQITPNLGNVLYKLILKPTILSELCTYLQTRRPFFYSPNILLSYPSTQDSIETLSRKAFLYHRDIDNTLAVKLFVVLNTCTGGNHRFIRASHSLNPKICHDTIPPPNIVGFHEACRPSSKYNSHTHTGRFDRNRILDLYGKCNEITFSNMAYSYWFEDTYGLHCGTPSHSGKRLIASFLIGQLPIRYR